MHDEGNNCEKRDNTKNANRNWTMDKGNNSLSKIVETSTPCLCHPSPPFVHSVEMSGLSKKCLQMV